LQPQEVLLGEGAHLLGRGRGHRGKLSDSLAHYVEVCDPTLIFELEKQRPDKVEEELKRTHLEKFSYLEISPPWDCSGFVWYKTFSVGFDNLC